jgi:hypothetical protein
VEPLPAPEVRDDVVRCQPNGTGGCHALIFHSEVTGAADYVVEHAGVETPCSNSSDTLCNVFFPSGPPGCDTTLRAVAADGRRGTPSDPFCVVR